MLYRIRISTTLFLILILCGILQIGSNGLSFWAFRDGQNNIYRVDQSSQQLSTLTESRAAMLQASTMLNKAGTLAALSYPPNEVRAMVDDVKQNLSQGEALFQGFMALQLMSESDKALQEQTAKSFTTWHEMLAHQVAWLCRKRRTSSMPTMKAGARILSAMWRRRKAKARTIMRAPR